MRHVRILLALFAAPFAGCDSGSGGDVFRELTNAGVTHIHTVDRTGTFPMPEILGAGVAVFDANGDGWLDLYFTDAGRVGGKGAPNRLYLRQENGTYRDATQASGLGDAGYGMGVAVGDIDNDGDLDVYVANDGVDALYRNDQGKFVNVSASAGIEAAEWSTSVAFFDFDVDGLLDIYVANYVKYDPNRHCSSESGRRTYCAPKVFPGVTDRLYRNLGGGKFADVSKKAGLYAVASAGLGVIVEDFDDDGWPDVFVANDGEANHLWMNNKDGTFREEALMMGTAVNANGAVEASMGVAVGDVDSDGDVDLFMTHLGDETNTLYVREKFGFEDRSMRSGLATPSLAFTGFGTAFADVDQDGDLDVLVANGRVMQKRPDPKANIDPLWNQFAERNQLFLGDGQGGFSEVTDSSFCQAVEVSRGLAMADLDGDGDLDAVVTNCMGPVRIFENVSKRPGGWLQVRAMDGELRRDVYGAVVFVHAGGKVYRRTISPQQSYISSSQIAAHFGLGGASAIEKVRVRWPGGAEESFPGGAIDRVVTVTRGGGSK